MFAGVHCVAQLGLRRLLREQMESLFCSWRYAQEWQLGRWFSGTAPDLELVGEQSVSEKMDFHESGGERRKGKDVLGSKIG